MVSRRGKRLGFLEGVCLGSWKGFERRNGMLIHLLHIVYDERGPVSISGHKRLWKVWPCPKGGWWSGISRTNQARAQKCKSDFVVERHTLMEKAESTCGNILVLCSVSISPAVFTGACLVWQVNNVTAHWLFTWFRLSALYFVDIM